jgi:hypothetical protein
VRKPRVVAPKPNQEQKDKIYGQLLNVTDIEKLDKTAFAKEKGFNAQSITGMISNMINFSGVYNELRKKGFTDAQIPKWVARPPPPSTTPITSIPPAPSPGAALKPLGTLPIGRLGQENVGEGVVGVGGSGDGSGRSVRWSGSDSGFAVCQLPGGVQPVPQEGGPAR